MMHRPRRQKIAGLLVTLWLVLLVPAPVHAQVSSNPGYDRPGLGFTPAVLQAGDVTLEQGIPDWSRAEGSATYQADTLVRLGVGRALELQLGTGWNWLDGGGYSPDGRSDTSLAMKFAPASAGNFSWGVLGSVEFTDGARAFRSTRRQYVLAASFNWQRVADRSFGLYTEVMEGEVDAQLVAANAGWALSATLGFYVELAAQHADDAGYGTVGGAGLTWQATPRVQLDVSARHRVGGHADTWQGGLGVAVYFGG